MDQPAITSTAATTTTRGPGIDVRCAALLPVRGARCQLFAGHDGDHAVMFTRAGERAVRGWGRGRSVDRDIRDAQQRPWMRGYPVPAWSEPDGSPSAPSTDATPQR
jgi:hypothetical protein